MENRKLFIAISILLVASVAAASVPDRMELSRELAKHKLRSLDGTETTLSDLRGQVVVVNFWASWCSPCRRELPVMNKWNEAWSGKGARVIAISIDKDIDNARRLAEEAGLTMTVLHDGPKGLAKQLDLPSLPCTFVLDRDGKVVMASQSSTPGDLALVEEQVNTMLSRDIQKASSGGTQ